MTGGPALRLSRVKAGLNPIRTLIDPVSCVSVRWTDWAHVSLALTGRPDCGGATSGLESQGHLPRQGVERAIPIDRGGLLCFARQESHMHMPTAAFRLIPIEGAKTWDASVRNSA
jgi:hypothetical protein